MFTLLSEALLGATISSIFRFDRKNSAMQSYSFRQNDGPHCELWGLLGCHWCKLCEGSSRELWLLLRRGK